MNNTRQQLRFFERLHTLLKAGIPLQESVFIISEQQSAKKKKLFSTILSSLSHGHSLTESLKHLKIVNPYIISYIQNGEETGNLIQNIEFTALELQKTITLKQKIISALLYPASIALMTIALCVFLIGYIFPKLLPLFSSMNTSLPLTTRLLIYSTNFFEHYGIIVISLLISLIIVFIYFYRKKYIFRKKVQNFLLRVPLVSICIKNYELARITRNLSLLLKSSLPIDTALLSTNRAISFIPYHEALIFLQQSILAGESFSKSIQKFPELFPLDMYHLMIIAERSGTFSECFYSLSQTYENEIEKITKLLSSALEPALMIVMGCIVGFVALSIITPLYAITQHIK